VQVSYREFITIYFFSSKIYLGNLKRSAAKGKNFFSSKIIVFFTFGSLFTLHGSIPTASGARGSILGNTGQKKTTKT
jgi:hypothetical protein